MADTQHIPPAPSFTPEQLGPLCLVTGGAGYVGSALVRRLREHGCRVRSLDVVAHSFDGDPEVETVVADLRHYADVRRACEGVDTIFHTAALINLLSIYRPAQKRLVYEVNCVGTRNLIKAAQAAKVTALVQTSTFSVVLDRVLNNQDESLPYATRTHDLYSMTKIEAERMVLAADDPQGLRTCALRPGGVWGSDCHSIMIRSFLESLATGRFKAIIGSRRATMDNTHVDNLIDAHFLAAKSLREAPQTAAGQAYFINDDEQVNGLVWFQPMVEALGHKFPRLSLPAPMMKWVGRGMEVAHFFGGPEPTLTHRGVRNLTESSSFRIDKARRELGYEPRFTRANGFPLLLPNARAFMAQLQGQPAA